MEANLPPLIAKGRVRQFGLANDLGPHVYGFERVGPLVIVQFGPRLMNAIRHDFIPGWARRRSGRRSTTSSLHPVRTIARSDAFRYENAWWHACSGMNRNNLHGHR